MIQWTLCPARSKKIEKDGNWGIGKDRTFLSLPDITLSPQNSIFVYLRTYPERPGISFSTPMPGNIYIFLSLSLSADWSSIYLFLYISLSFVIDHLYLFLSLIYLPIVQMLISLFIPQYLFLPRNEECSSKKYIVSILHRGGLLLHWLYNIITLIEKEYKIF